MGKIYGICDFRRGKIGDLVFRKVADKNIVSEKANYYPVNSAWLKKQEFKNYVLSLLNEGIPQVYILNELPEEIYPYALIFIQNQGGISIYVDKEGVRTEIQIEGSNSDAVDIVNNIPGNPRNNTIYFVNNPESKNKNKNILDYDLYVCENSVLKKIELYSVDSTLQMTDNTIGLPDKLDSAKSLGLYKTAFDAQGRCTNVETYTIPHLYLHHYRYARQTRGDVNLYIYTTSSTELNNTQLGDYLYNLGCNARWSLFPACGEAQYSLAMVDGMYATLNSGSLVKYNFHVVSHNSSNEYDELIANYTHSYGFTKIQIF